MKRTAYRPPAVASCVRLLAAPHLVPYGSLQGTKGQEKSDRVGAQTGNTTTKGKHGDTRECAFEGAHGTRQRNMIMIASVIMIAIVIMTRKRLMIRI